MMNTKALVDLLIRYRTWLLILCAVTVAIAFVPSMQLRFERSVENLFRKDDPRYENYRLDRRLFGGIETALIAYDDPDLISERGLRQLADLQRKLSAIEGVNKVTSLNDVRRSSAILEGSKLSDQLQQKKVTAEDLKSEILGTELYRDRLVTADGKTALLLLEFAPVGDDPGLRAKTIDQIKSLANDRDPPAVVLGGPVLVEEIFATLEDDGVLLGVSSSLILTLVIALMFRSLRWTLLPLAVVHVSLIWTKALVAFSGMQLSMVSAQLVALVTVIGVATSVHVMVRYREERANADVKEALRNTLVHIVPAIFWTCLTTAAGFAALFASNVAPFQTFGAMMALGAMLVFFAALLIVPAAALVCQRFDTTLGRLPAEGTMTGMLERVAYILKKYPWRVIVSMVILVAVCSLGASKLSVATDFTNNFRHTSSIVKSYLFLKERLPSVDTMDVLVELPEIKSKEFEEAILSVRRLQSKLESDPRVVNTVSLVDLLDFLDKAIEESGKGQQKGLQSWLPAIGGATDRAKVVLLQAIQPGLAKSFLNQEENTARIMVQLKPVSGSSGKTRLIQDVEKIAQEEFDSAKVAGFYVLLASVVDSLLGDQWTTFGLSVVAIFLIMSIAFRSLSLGLVAMVPNAAPIFVVLGAMGWLGLDINMATAMMASVSMGLSVDFSIHYLYRFRQELQSGSPFFDALTKAHGSVGLAMLVANIALIAGFLCLTLSALIPSVHFGLMVSVAMLGGLIGNLVVLPLLLRLLWKMGWIKES